jgi:hypothetical protein
MEAQQKGLFERYYALKCRKDEVETELGELNDEMRNFQDALLNYFAESGMKSVKLEMPDGKLKAFELAKTNRYSVPKESRSQLTDILIDQEMRDLLSVNHQTLHGFLKELVESQDSDAALKEKLEPLVTTFTQEVIRVR